MLAYRKAFFSFLYLPDFVTELLSPDGVNLGDIVLALAAVVVLGGSYEHGAALDRGRLVPPVTERPSLVSRIIVELQRRSG